MLQAQTQQDRSLGDIAREIRAKSMPADSAKTAISSPAKNSAKETPPSLVTDSAEPARFMVEARALLMREDFSALDKMADTVRSSKARFPGGGWKLTRFYDALAESIGNNATEADWQSHLALLQRWKTARPQSITARIAIAGAYLNYAWVARGNGYGNTVTDEGWRLFAERSQQAAKVLMEAATLPSKCPRWYELMQQVALATGANKNQHRAVFEKAIEFEPLYFAYYQRYALALLPKWEGEPGDVEALAEESYRRVGGKQGANIYFEIVSNLCGTCGDFYPQGFSWPKLQEGFAATEELYGLSALKVNRFAFLAASYGDKDVAAKAFLRIGPNWDPSVWGTRARFESQRTWAGLPAGPQPGSTAVSQPDVALPASAQVEETLVLASLAASERHWSDSKQLALQAINTAKSLPGTEKELGRAYLLLAGNEYHQGHGSEAQALLDQGISAVSDKAGGESVELAATLAQTAVFAQFMNDDVRADADLRRAIAIQEKKQGSSDPELANYVTQLGYLCHRRGRTKEAIELYQRAIRVRDAAGPDDLATASPLGQLGVLYQDMHRNQEAESAFLRMLHVLEGHFGMHGSELIDPLSKLAGLYHSTGKLENEERMRKRLQLIQMNNQK